MMLGTTNIKFNCVFVCEFLHVYFIGQIKDLLKSFTMQRKIRISCKFRRKNLNRSYFHEHSLFNIVICVISTYHTYLKPLTEQEVVSRSHSTLMNNQNGCSVNRATLQSPPLDHGIPTSSIYLLTYLLHGAESFLRS